MFRLRRMMCRLGRVKYSLKDFRTERVSSDDTYNKVKRDSVTYTFFHNDIKIGIINVNPHNGQIGLLWLDPVYRGWGIGKDMVSLAEKTLPPSRTKLWCVTRYDHPFWKKQKNAKWSDLVDKSVRGAGYSFDRVTFV